MCLVGVSTEPVVAVAQLEVKLGLEALDQMYGSNTKELEGTPY